MDEKVYQFARKLAARKARKLACIYGFSNSMRKDLEQRLLTDLVKRLAKYDPKKSPLSAFISMVIKNELSKVLTQFSRARKLAVVNCLSLEDEIEDQQETLGEMIIDKRVSCPDVAADVNMIIDSLPPMHRKACRLLMGGTSTFDVAREIKISHIELQKVIIPMLQEAFKDYSPNL